MLRVTRWFVLAVAGPAAVAGCGSSTSPGPRTPVAFHVAMPAGVAAAGSVTASSSSPLEIRTVRIGIQAAALGRGDQFGCIDCQDNTSDAGSDSGHGTAPGVVVNVPLSGVAVRIPAEPASPGSYTMAEFSLAPLAGPPYPSAAWAAGTTIEIDGQFGGAPFTLSLPVSGTFVEALGTPIQVTGAGTASEIQVTITLPVASWFQAGSAWLDPAVPASRLAIEANVRRAFAGSERPETEGGQ